MAMAGSGVDDIDGTFSTGSYHEPVPKRARACAAACRDPLVPVRITNRY